MALDAGQWLYFAGISSGGGRECLYLLDPRAGVMWLRLPRRAYHVPAGDVTGPTVGHSDAGRVA
eukprot:6240287-Lingulodinium_polyedra.AAC.1